MMTFDRLCMHVCLLTCAALASGCQPPLDDLDPDAGGDEAEGTTAANHDECFEGSDPLGAPGSAYEPDCTVVCAGPAEQALLDTEWTVALELEIEREPTWFNHHIAQLDADRLLVASSAPSGEGVRLATLALADGELLALVEQPELGRLDDLVVSSAGIHAAWRSDDATFVGELTDTGEVVWMAPLSPSSEWQTQLEVGSEGVTALVPDEQLVRFSLAGELLGSSETDSLAFARRESGGFVGLEGVGVLSLNWYDALGVLEEEHFIGASEFDGGLPFDLRMLDDDRVAVAHLALQFFYASFTRVSAYERDLDVPLWTYEHHRASPWCEDEPTTRLPLLERVGEARMIVAGNEALGWPYEQLDGLGHASQPFVALLDVSSGAELVARDRGLWPGEVLDLVVVDERAIALMSRATTTSGSLLVRSYTLPE